MARRAPTPGLTAVDLLETVRLAGPLRVDPEQRLIRGLKILGLASDNGRRYTPEAVRKAAALYEGKRVNCDHPARPSDSRSVYDRLGKFVNVRAGPDGLRGDLKFLGSHRLARSLAEAAGDPELLDVYAFSHNAEGRGRQVDGVFVVEEITAVRSVDLVADAATTKSLVEGAMNPALYDEEETAADAEAETPAADAAPGSSLLAGFRDEIMKIVDSENDWQTKKSLIGELLKLQDKAMSMGKEPAATEEGEGEDDEEDEEELESRRPRRSAKGAVALAERRELKRLRRAEKAQELIEAARVQPNRVLRLALMAAKDEAEMWTLIKEYQAAAKPPQRPRSQPTDRPLSEGNGRVTDAKTFAAAILRRR